MLRPGSRARFARSDDLLVRMHLLPGVCGDEAQGPLPQLRRRIGPAPSARGRAPRQISRFGGAEIQARRLRRPPLTEISALNPPSCRRPDTPYASQLDLQSPDLD